MIAFWFLPTHCDRNTFILKPSERVPLTMRYIYELLEKTGLPKGVVNLVNGAKTAVDTLLDDPRVRAISFVGSTPVARYIYARAGANGKRAQCRVCQESCDRAARCRHAMATQIIADAHSDALATLLAVSVAVTIGEAQKTFAIPSPSSFETSRGERSRDGVQMGPVITRQSKDRIESMLTSRETGCQSPDRWA